MDQDHPDACEYRCEKHGEKPDSHPCGQRRKRFRNHLILFRESLGFDPALTNVAVFVTLPLRHFPHPRRVDTHPEGLLALRFYSKGPEPSRGVEGPARPEVLLEGP